MAMLRWFEGIERFAARLWPWALLAFAIAGPPWAISHMPGDLPEGLPLVVLVMSWILCVAGAFKIIEGTKARGFDR